MLSPQGYRCRNARPPSRTCRAAGHVRRARPCGRRAQHVLNGGLAAVTRGGAATAAGRRRSGSSGGGAARSVVRRAGGGSAAVRLSGRRVHLRRRMGKEGERVFSRRCAGPGSAEFQDEDARSKLVRQIWVQYTSRGCRCLANGPACIPIAAFRTGMHAQASANVRQAAGGRLRMHGLGCRRTCGTLHDTGIMAG